MRRDGQIILKLYYPNENIISDPLDMVNISIGLSMYQGNCETIFFTGMKDSQEKDIFEYDVYRQETDDGDEIFENYYIVTWVKEWGIFAALDAYEFYKYKTKGAEELDEIMFWTFILDEVNERSIIGSLLTNKDKFTRLTGVNFTNELIFGNK